MTLDGQAQVVQPYALEERQHVLVPMPVCALLSPGDYHEVDLTCDAAKPVVVLGTDRIGSGTHLLRIRRHEREGVQHVEAAETPLPSEVHTSGDGWVAPHLIRPRRVQADEGDPASPAAQRPPQPVAMKAVWGESRALVAWPHAPTILLGFDGAGVGLSVRLLDDVVRHHAWGRVPSLDEGSIAPSGTARFTQLPKLGKFPGSCARRTGTLRSRSGTGRTLCRLPHRLPADLREIDAGGDPEALRTNRTPKFLRPSR